MEHPGTRIVVIGGGIAGLSAAWQLAKNPNVIVRILEASDHFGGKIHTTDFSGLPVDVGADAFLARVPEGVQLCEELGIADELISPARNNAMLWSRGQLHPFPTSTVLGIPSDLEDPAIAAIISPEGIERARRELDLTEPVMISGNVSVGALVSARFGTEIKERLVDPLVGGINGGNIDELEVAAATPQIVDLTNDPETNSLTAAARRRHAKVSAGETPTFYAPDRGMQRIVDALTKQLAEQNVELSPSTRVNAIAERDDQWLVTTEQDVLGADAIVLATPSHQAAELLRNSAPAAANALDLIRYASVAVVRLAYERSAIGIDLNASGFVVPAVESKLITACSWTSSKWERTADPSHVILKASVGRFRDERALSMTDEEMAVAVHEELTHMMRIDSEPIEGDVTRWPRAFPQYTPGHTGRVERIREGVKQLETIALAGAAYNGLGVPACIRSGFAAADEVIQALCIDLR